jgi:hypothetical protein
MNDNDNANMYEIFERLNRVQAMPSKIDEAAAKAAEKTRLDESAFQAAIGKKKYGDEGMKALQKAGRDHASDKTMKNIRNKYDKYDEAQVNELSPDTLNSYADKAKGQRNWAHGRAMAGQQGNQAADPTGKFDKLADKRAAGYNKAVAKGARDLDKSGTRSSWNYDEAQVNEIGDTPRGQAALTRVAQRNLSGGAPLRGDYYGSPEWAQHTPDELATAKAVAGPGKSKVQDYSRAVDRMSPRVKQFATTKLPIGADASKYAAHPSDQEGMLSRAGKAIKGALGMKEEGGTPMTPKQKSFAKLAPPADKITFADKIAGAKQEVDEMLGDVAADAIKKAISTHKGGKVSGAKGVTKHSAGADVYGGSAPDKGHAVDRMKGPSDTALRGKRKQETEEGNAFSGAMAKAKATGADEFKVGSKEYKVKENFPTVADAEKRLRGKEGKTDKGTVTKTATGLRHTRDYEHDVGADDEKSSSGEKRSAGRPKKYSDDAPRQERVTAKSRKTDRTAHGQAGFKKDKVKENNVDIVDQGEYDQEGDMAKNDIKTIVRHAQALHKILGDSDNLPEWVQSKLAKIEAMMISVDEYMQNQDDKEGQEPVAEKAVSKKQQRFMGMVHSAQKGKKPASKEVAKVAKTMGKKDAEDFASTKHKGLPDKAKKKKEESVEETTTSGSVAAAPSTGNSKGGMSFGKGIYDSVDRKVEAIIAESMSINMSTSTEGGQTITVTASDEDAMKLASLLKMAGIGSSESDGGCNSCGESPCGCDHVDENAPDWPTNKEYNGNALQYAGGLNKPKETGQTTAPVFSRDERRQHTPESEELTRIREIAGLKEAAKPDFLDMDKDGDKEEPMKKAVKDKDEEKKVEESIFALTNQWRAYKG